MIKTLIVEDEPYIRKGLVKMIESLNTKIHIVGQCESVRDAVSVITTCNIDLVLLDINLIGGTAFDFLEQTEASTFKVIFITAYEEFALKALKRGAVDYILKPIDINELKTAIEKLDDINLLNKEQLSVVKNHYENKDKSRLVLRLQEGFQVIVFKELIYCKSDAGYTTFYLKNGKKFIASKSINKFENQLPNKKFIRTHQSYIVNMDHVDKFDKDGYVFMKSGIKIPVSTRKKDFFISKLFEKNDYKNKF